MILISNLISNIKHVFFQQNNTRGFSICQKIFHVRFSYRSKEHCELHKLYEFETCTDSLTKQSYPIKSFHSLKYEQVYFFFRYLSLYIYRIAIAQDIIYKYFTIRIVFHARNVYLHNESMYIHLKCNVDRIVEYGYAKEYCIPAYIFICITATLMWRRWYLRWATIYICIFHILLSRAKPHGLKKTYSDCILL